MPTGAGRSVPPAQIIWLGLAALAALANLYDTPFPELAPLQNLPTLAVVVAIAWGLRRWPLPTSAVACLAAFLLLHSLGARYIYSYVPYDDWARALGLPAPTEVFGLRRNHYDRLVHFAFGLLMVHPAAAWLRMRAGLRPRLALHVATGFVFAASAIYEIFEWLLTVVMAGADADAYNGQQGDLWECAEGHGARRSWRRAGLALAQARQPALGRQSGASPLRGAGRISGIPDSCSLRPATRRPCAGRGPANAPSSRLPRQDESLSRPLPAQGRRV